MRRPGNCGRVQRLLLEAQEPFRQPVELGAGLFHHLPLFRQLVGQFLYSLGLMRDRFLKRNDPFSVSDVISTSLSRPSLA